MYSSTVKSSSIAFVICMFSVAYFSFFFNDTATTEIYTLSLHDALPIWPGRLRQLRHLLERDAGGAGGVLQHQPVLPVRVRLSGGRRLVARAVPQAQQLPVELRQRPRVGGIQHDLPQQREPIAWSVHSATSVGEHYRSAVPTHTTSPRRSLEPPPTNDPRPAHPRCTPSSAPSALTDPGDRRAVRLTVAAREGYTCRTSGGPLRPASRWRRRAVGPRPPRA